MSIQRVPNYGSNYDLNNNIQICNTTSPTPSAAPSRGATPSNKRLQSMSNMSLPLIKKMNFSNSNSSLKSIDSDQFQNLLSTPHHGEAHLNFSDMGTSSISSAVWNQVNSIIGAGIVGLPYVFNSAGYLGGVILILIFSSLTIYTLQLLMKAAKIARRKNYEDLCEHCFGLPGYYLVSISMLIFDFGATLTYFIILGDSASHIIINFGYASVQDRQYITLFLALVIVLPACLPRDISKIEKVSALSVLTVVLILLAVLYEWVSSRLFLQNDYFSHRIPNVNMINLRGIPEAIGMVAFSFVCHDNSFLIYKTLKNPTAKRWKKLCQIGVNFAVVISLFFSIPGYLTFGDHVKPNILNNYHSNNVLMIIVRSLYVLTMCLCFPVSFFVVRHVLYATFHHGPKYTSMSKAPLWEYLLFTIPVFTLILTLAMFIQDLGIVMSVSGSLSAVVLAFVLPPLCYLKLTNYRLKFRLHINSFDAFVDVVPPVVICFCGILVAVFVTAFTIYQKIFNQV